MCEWTISIIVSWHILWYYHSPCWIIEKEFVHFKISSWMMHSLFDHVFLYICVHNVYAQHIILLLNGSILTTGIALWYTERSTQCWVSCTWCCCICLLGIWPCILSCRYEKHIGAACSPPFNSRMLWSRGTHFPLYSILVFIYSYYMQNFLHNFSPSYAEYDQSFKWHEI